MNNNNHHKTLQQENAELKRVIEQLKWDPAYDCYTRAGMEYIKWPEIAAEAAWIIIGDIDYMHELNEKHTHNGMDARIKDSIKMRSSDYATCRIKSGDELGWVITESPDRDATDPEGLAERLQESFASNGIQITLGVVRVIGSSFKENVDRAEALYEQAKADGRRGTINYER